MQITRVLGCKFYSCDIFDLAGGPTWVDDRFGVSEWELLPLVHCAIPGHAALLDLWQTTVGPRSRYRSVAGLLFVVFVFD